MDFENDCKTIKEEFTNGGDEITLDEDEIIWKDDCETIKKEFANRGYEINLDEAEMIWKEYCVLKYYASWLPVGEGIDRHTFKELMELDVTKEILSK